MTKYATAVLGSLLLSIGLATAAVAGGETTVLFDEGHGQRFLVDQEEALGLSSLAKLCRDQGLTVHASKQGIDDLALADAHGLVISGAFSPLAPSEVDAIRRFVERGGALAVMTHIGPPVVPLLDRLGVAISNGVIREHENIIEDQPLNFRVRRMKAHDLTMGVEEFNVYGAWALINMTLVPTIIAETGPMAWVDLNRDEKLNGRDAIQSFGVVVAGQLGKGRFAVFGDDAIFQNRFLIGGNLVLGKNLARWLAGPT